MNVRGHLTVLTVLMCLPVQVGEEVVATVSVAKRSGRRVIFDTHIKATDGRRLLVDGTALAMFPPSALTDPSALAAGVDPAVE